MSFLPIKISNEAYTTILNDLQAAYPNEGCGFLFGSDTMERSIEKAIEVDNSKQGDKRRRFEIKPIDYMNAEKYAEKNNLTLLGVYHSHPDHPARPSEHDLKQAVPFFSYIIVSVKNGEVADITSWQLDDSGKFKEESILNETIKFNKNLNKII